MRRPIITTNIVLFFSPLDYKSTWLESGVLFNYVTRKRGIDERIKTKVGSYEISIDPSLNFTKDIKDQGQYGKPGEW